MKFRASGLYISVLPPLGVGALVGFLAGIMGVGGGFILVPAMIYILGMPTKVVIGTSLFQIIFVTGFTTVVHAVNSHTVDMMLALLLIAGGVVGAQIGTLVGVKLRAEQLRILLAVMVLSAWNVIQGTMQIGDLTAVMLMLLSLYAPLNILGWAWREIREGAPFDAMLAMVRGVRELGMEACVTAGMLSDGQAQRPEHRRPALVRGHRGATGRLQLDGFGNVVRAPSWSTFSGGRPMPIANAN